VYRYSFNVLVWSKHGRTIRSVCLFVCMILVSRLILVAGPAEVVASNCRSFGEGWISQLVCSLLRFVVILFVIFMYTFLEICRKNRSIKVLRS
jgi:hypothetical protein